MLREQEEGYGQALYDYLHGQGGFEIVERDDGFFSLSGGPQVYFSTYEQWPLLEQEAIQLACGRVLDVGCGAGRHALYLQDRGLEVVGIDISPRAVEVCRARGLRQVQQLSVTQASTRLGTFDTILMFGNNLGLLANPQRGRWLLRRFRRLTTDQGRILAQSRDPYATDAPEHLSYHAFNRQRGRPAGQLRLRIRYKHYATPWFDYWLVAPAELEGLLASTGWRLTRTIPGEGGTYVAMMEQG